MISLVKDYGCLHDASNNETAKIANFLFKETHC